jgi:predicted transcriptional regulator
VTEINEAIISIHPNFANAILAGTKTVELRRRIPPIVVGTRLWIYATRPTAAIIGSAVVDRILRGNFDEVWAECGINAGINRTNYDEYFLGAVEAIAISLVQVRRGMPIEIDKLRSMRRDFHPPQVMAKVSPKEVNAIQNWSNAVL